MASPFTRDLEGFRRYLETHPSRNGRLRRKSTVEQYMYIAERLAEWLGRHGIRDFRDVNHKLLEKFITSYEIRWFAHKGGGVSPWRRNQIISVLTLLYRYLNDGEDPKWIDKIKAMRIKLSPSEGSRVRSPSDLLTDEEIAKLLKACEGARSRLQVIRDQCLISLLYESGCRIGEILDLKIRDIFPTEYGFKIRVHGKTGMRTVPIIDSKSYLLKWLNVHPYGDDGEAPLFIRFVGGEMPIKAPLRKKGAQSLIKRLAKRAGIKKRVYCHLFRHTRATELTSYISEAYMKKLLGWSKTSQMPSFYIHLSGADIERELLVARGILPQRQLKPVLEKKICEFCGFENDPHFTYCAQCGRPLKTSVEVLKELDEAHKVEERIKRLEEEMREFKEFILTALKAGFDPATLRDLINFYEKSKRAKGKVVELKVTPQ